MKYFLEFLKIDNTSEKYLFKIIVDEIKTNEFNNNLRE